MAFLPQRLLRLTGFSSTYLTGTAGSNGEIYYDLQTKSLRIMDGTLKGGYQMARTDLNNVTNATFLSKATSAGVLGVQSGQAGRLAYYPSTGTQVNDLAEVYWHTHDGSSMLHVEGTIDVSGAKNRIRFHWDTLTDLNNEVNPATYHGMIAHVHSTGSVYFAHSASWNKLANDSELAAVAKSGNYTDLTNKPVLSAVATSGSYNDLTNVPSAAPPTTVSSTAPASPSNGQIWFDLETGNLYIYVNDGSSSQWVQPASPVFSGAGSVTWNDISGKPNFATVSTSGLYSDLTGTPSIPAAYSVTSINALSDVDTTTTPPTAGQVLKWNGTNWAPAADATTGGAGTDADTLDGFDSTYYLNYNNLSNKPTLNGFNLAGSASIVAGNGIAVTTDAASKTISLGISPTLFTVAADDSTQRSINRGEVIKFVGSGGITTASDAEGTITITGSGAGAANLDGLSDVVITSPSTNQYLRYNGSNWVNETVSAASTPGFVNFAVAGQSTVQADQANDTLTLVAGTNITITTESASDTITISASGSGSNSFETIAVAGQSNVVADSATDTLTLVAGAGIVINTNASTDTISITNGLQNFTALTDVASTAMTIDQAYLPAITRLVVTNNGSASYSFDQYGAATNPTIYAISGTTIAFNINAIVGHPFLIQTAAGANYNTGLVHVSTSGSVLSGSLAQGQTSGTLYWKIPYNVTGNYRYQCSLHGAMQGTINIRDITTI